MRCAFWCFVRGRRSSGPPRRLLSSFGRRCRWRIEGYVVHATPHSSLKPIDPVTCASQQIVIRPLNQTEYVVPIESRTHLRPIQAAVHAGEHSTQRLIV